VDRARGIVECAIVSVLEVGFLEQYVCSPSTREHESLFVFDGKASELHAALLLAGFAPGSPGSWREVAPAPQGDAAGAGEAAANQRFEVVPPTGERIAISVVMPDGIERELPYFVRPSPLSQAADARPPSAFVFAGSRFRTDRRTGIERYLADGSGSVVGLVTFGDETIAALDVLPDQAAVSDPVWEVYSERMPKPGTRLTLRLAPVDRRAPSGRRAPRRAGNAQRRGGDAAPRRRRQIKRPGRDRASGRALPGALEEVGKRLPRSKYGVVRLGQANSLGNPSGDLRISRYRTGQAWGLRSRPLRCQKDFRRLRARARAGLRTDSSAPAGLAAPFLPLPVVGGSKP
jgi:hypothetical protein